MKDITECHARLRGLFNITVTPFKVDGAFDMQAWPGISSGLSASALTAS